MYFGGRLVIKGCPSLFQLSAASHHAYPTITILHCEKMILENGKDFV